MSQEPDWKKLKLSLERPYKDDQGLPVSVLLDITADGQHIYEPQKDLATAIGEKLHRIFLERGHDFFDKRVDERKHEPALPSQEGEAEPSEASATTKSMTPEELLQLRMEILPQLHIALGEMSQARDLLSILLASNNASQPSVLQSLSQQLSQPPLSQMSLSQSLTQTAPQSTPQNQPDVPSASLTSTVVTKPLPIQSVHAFNTQLAIGSKDKALRHASGLFRSAAHAMEESRLRGEKYWVDALKMRRNNWGLIPAPLPPGSATGKGADKTSKDFLVSFGLEESSLMFKRRAIGRMSTTDASGPSIEFPLRQHVRLQVSLIFTATDGHQLRGRNSYKPPEESNVERALRAAQAEVVQQEIFSILVGEAAKLPTTSARVSERLIAIEAAQATELRFELVDSDYVPPDHSTSSSSLQATCDLIYSSLHLLLLRAHMYTKTQRLGRAGTADSSQPVAPLTLQPIVDMLQYQVFCYRVQAEIDKIVHALSNAGIATKSYFNAVGESGEELAAQLQPQNQLKLTGDCLLRIDNHRSLRFTFSSPSTLIAHLSQATLPITSIPQLAQLLADEVESCLLQRICDVGTVLCEDAHGTWFVDPLSGRSMGRWEGHVLNFSISFSNQASILCSVSRTERGERHPSTHVEGYSSESTHGVSLIQWVQRVVENAMAHS